MATALPSAAESALHATDEKANFQRLTRLLVCGGITLLREVFDSIHTPANLPTVLGNHKAQMQKLRNGNVINKQEWSLLYPSPGVYGNSTEFDITLLLKLFRNICNLTPPVTGWDNLPNSTDLSPEADLVRIKFYRNEVYGHRKNMEISDAELVDLWREISEALLRIAGSLSAAKYDEWKKSIDKFRHDPLTPDSAQSLAELQSWYKKDKDTKDLVEMVLEQTNTKLEQMDIKQQELINVVMHIRTTIEMSRQCESCGNSGHLHTSPRPQEAGPQTGSVCIPISPEQPQTEQAVGSLRSQANPQEEEAAGSLGPQTNPQGEEEADSLRPQTNQQISSPSIIWRVILSFRNAFNLLVEYLRIKLGVDVQDSRLGSLIITVSCRSLQVVEGLWEDYQSGHLNEVIQETLVTTEVLKELGLSEVKLKTIISEEEYKACKEQITLRLAALPVLHGIPGSDDFPEKTYVRFKTLESKTVFVQYPSPMFPGLRLYDGIVQMEAGCQEGIILDIKVSVFWETTTAERQKDKNGPAELEVIGRRQVNNKHLFSVDLDSVYYGPVSLVYQLAKVEMEKRNLFQLLVELSVFNGMEKETLPFYSKPFLIKYEYNVGERKLSGNKENKDPPFPSMFGSASPDPSSRSQRIKSFPFSTHAGNKKDELQDSDYGHRKRKSISFSTHTGSPFASPAGSASPVDSRSGSPPAIEGLILGSPFTSPAGSTSSDSDYGRWKTKSFPFSTHTGSPFASPPGSASPGSPFASPDGSASLGLPFPSPPGSASPDSRDGSPPAIEGLILGLPFPSPPGSASPGSPFASPAGSASPVDSRSGSPPAIEGLILGSPYDNPLCSPAYRAARNYKPEAIGGNINYIASTGYVLVIDNCTTLPFKRSASFHVKPLLDLYDRLGFTVKVCNNLTKSAMLKLLEDTTEKDFSNYNCFVCVIVSHGSVEGEIYGTDDEVINLEAITALFNCSRCPQLEGKPKIFLIEAFQEDEPAKIPSSGPFSSANFLDGDFLICYACSPDRAVFLTTIAKVFKNHSEEEHILEMMLRVNRLVEPHFKIQRPWQISTLTKKVYFPFLFLTIPTPPIIR